MVSKGILITIEGVSGTGKTTFGEFLCSFFQNNFNKVRLVGNYEKSKRNSLLTKAILELLKKDRFLRVGWERETALLVAEFLETIEEDVEPALNEDYVIIFENYSDAIIAYQTARLKESRGYHQYSEDELLEYTKNVLFPFFKNVPKPNYTILLTCSQNIIKKRLEQREKMAYTKMDEELQVFTERLYKKMLLSRKNFIIIDSTSLNKKTFLKAAKDVYDKISGGLKIE